MEAPSRHEVLERRTGRSSCVEFPIRRCYQKRRGIAAAVELRTRALSRIAAGVTARPGDRLRFFLAPKGPENGPNRVAYNRLLLDTVLPLNRLRGRHDRS